MLKALIDARKRISQQREIYVCYALEASGLPRRKKAERLVVALLDGAVTYEEWMARNHPRKYWAMSWNHFREGRIQWLDHLIKNERSRIRRKRNNSAVHFPRRKK